jgi:hypothetical protein
MNDLQKRRVLTVKLAEKLGCKYIKKELDYLFGQITRSICIDQILQEKSIL